MRSALRIIASFILGLALGYVYFSLIHPALGGMEGGRSALERGDAIGLFFRGVPIICLLIMIATALMFPKSAEETFCLAFISALSCLLPIPFANYFAEAPSQYGRPLFSFFIIGNGIIGIAYFSFAAFLIAGLSCLVISLFINPLFRKNLRRS
jgi:hypothetical protein